MIDKVKLSLRIRHHAIDEDLQDMISACKLDLARVGIKNISDTDPLIIQLVKLYIKWQLNYEDAADRYIQAYEMMRNSISLSGDYNV